MPDKLAFCHSEPLGEESLSKSYCERSETIQKNIFVILSAVATALNDYDYKTLAIRFCFGYT